MKITYETHYRSEREDGRHVATMAAFLERLRQTTPALAMPEKMAVEEFSEWQKKIKQKVWELLRLDVLLAEAEGQPAPKRISSVQRDGYTVEKWECYPDPFSAVPFLALIPDGASAEHRVPAVMCFPGSNIGKEFMAGEPLLERKTCGLVKYTDCNQMALYMVKNGMAAFVFDNPATAECALEVDKPNDHGAAARVHLCHGLLQNGFSYFGLSAAQKLCALEHILSLSYVDREKIAVSAHSLGCDDAMHIALLREEIKAVVFNDLVCDERQRYYAVTEYEEENMCNNVGNWHEVPGAHAFYGRPDLLAALAPRFLALNEGGAQVYLDQIRRAYGLFGAEDRLQISHYPKYREESSRSKQYDPPKFGLSADAFFEFTNTDAPDHSFREEPSIALLKKAFGSE